MSEWKKKNIAKEVVLELQKKYHCDALTASVLARRGITESSDIMYFFENDKRYLHNPFLFNDMEDAVDRILDAAQEKEKVLIFGDRDVDGITSTTLLYQYLKDLGLDVKYQLPEGDDAYGLSMKAVEAFAEEYGTLIITVDCGISNNAEIARAAELGIDVIVVDHHNAPGELPEPAIIINPKIEDSGYPFRDISGCAVVYKLLTALRFAQTELYKQEITLLNVQPLNDTFVVECIKTENLIEKERFSEAYVPGVISIQQTRLLPFLKGQQIFVWDMAVQKKMLAKIFGNNVEFNFMDLQPEISKEIPSVANMSLLRLKSMSRLAFYNSKPSTEIDSFFNLFVTYVQKKTTDKNKQLRDEYELQLVMLAAIADIMPLKNENRILVNQGLLSINTSNRIRPGLLEIMGRLNLLGKKVGSSDLSWNVIPVFNAAGRLGNPKNALELFLAEDPAKRNEYADQLIEMNNLRKSLGTEAFAIAEKAAYDSMERFSNNLSVVFDERINRGVTGIVAGRLSQQLRVPSIVMTSPNGDVVVGSVRSVRGFDVTEMLNQSDSLFLNHGGHNFAAGFSLKKENVEQFLNNLERFAPLIEFTEPQEHSINIDAELPENYIKPDLLKHIDLFEPYGEENPALTFLSRKIKILQADLMGKTGRLHLKLTLSCGQHKWPAIYWGAAERLGRDFNPGDYIDIVYQINRNTFNGIETPQMIIVDAKKSDN